MKAMSSINVMLASSVADERWGFLESSLVGTVRRMKSANPVFCPPDSDSRVVGNRFWATSADKCLRMARLRHVPLTGPHSRNHRTTQIGQISE